MPSPFIFGSYEPSTGDLVAQLPPGIDTKEELLSQLAERLRFPEYFGRNWDALGDCLRDLEWLGERRVVIRHSDLPPVPDTILRSYLEVLSWAVETWELRQGGHELVIVFPESARSRASAVMQ
jgi:hypothetical protein